ncbi:hypothetical protein MMC19_001328 [Ptychographa xylographoides]|nr:hypothetical protein [Ptychographa xylographoides]
MSSDRDLAILEHGFTPVPRDVDHEILRGAKNIKDPAPLLTKDIDFPSDPIVQKVQDHAKEQLGEQTYNHSMRVYYYGQAILRTQFPSWTLSSATYALACLLHDIGTTPTNLSSTLLSFEYYGAFLSTTLLSSLSSTQFQTEAVAEAIIRHQDIGVTGNITVLGQILQLATIFDNMGGHQEMVHAETICDVVKAYPRQGWSKCFAGTIRRENGLKPWAHTTSLGERDFPEGVEGNKLMEQYDQGKS